MKLVITTVGTTGDVRPFVALARALRGAGHTVRACSYDLYSNDFEAEGIEFVPIGNPVTQAQIRDTAERVAQVHSAMKQVQILQRFHLAGAREQYEDCRAATRGFDLAICHTIHTLGQAASMDNGLPWVGVRFEPTLVPTAYAPPMMMPNLGQRLNPLLWRALERGFARVDAVLRDVLAGVGSRQRDLQMFRTVSPHLNLVACSPALAGAYPDLPPHFRFNGAWTLDEPLYTPTKELVEFLDGGDKPVVVTYGSMAGSDAGSVTLTLLALVSIGQRAVVQKGMARAGPWPAVKGVMFVGYLPHGYLFPRSACVVHHGGAGTTHTTCAAGVPSVVVPHVGDQFYWATRLQRLGVAPSSLPRRRLTPGRLAERIQACIASKAMSDRAQEVAGQMAAEDGLGEARKLIESMNH